MSRTCLIALLGLLLAGYVSGWVVLVPGARAEANEPGPAQVSRPGDCAEAVSLLKAQEAKMSRELRRVQREVAALRQQLSEPGMREILSGIGYILGLFGVAFFVSARNYTRQSGQGN